VAVVARRRRLAQRDGSRHGRSNCRHCHAAYNNQQLTKKSGGNGDGNGDNDSDDDDNGNKGNGASGSLVRAWRWRWRQCGGGVGRHIQQSTIY
jgi:hypothetical protein